MIRVTEIESLLGIVGLRQSTKTGFDILDADNIASSSGLFVNDVSGLITTENIKDMQEDPSISDADFNTFLDNLQKSSLVNLCKSVFNEKDLIENRILYPYENDRQTALTNDTSFVGYEIDIAKRKDVNVVINKIMLDFEGVDSVEILLFNSTQNAAQETQAIATVTDSEKHQSVTWDLPAANSIAGGKWYVGYLRSGLTYRAYDRNYENASVKTGYNCFSIHPVQVPDWDSSTLFDVNDVEYAAETWGMNFDISCYKDYTSVIVENKDRFAKGLQLQMAADILNIMAGSRRINTSERIAKSEVLYELNGNRMNENIPYSVGVLNQLKSEIKDLRDAFFKPPRIQQNVMNG